MDITIPRLLLSERLTHVSKAANGRIIEIAECVLIEANERLTLTCTDTQMSIQSELDADINEVGVVAVHANKLLEIVKKLSGDAVRLKLNKGLLEIKSNSSKLSLATRPYDDFPMPSFNHSETITLSDEDFRYLASVKYAASKNIKDGPLSGLLFKFNDSTLTSFATNRHKLSKAEIELDGNYGNKEYIIPIEIIDAITKSDSNQLSLSFLDNRVSIKDDKYKYTGSLLVGVYPNVSSLVSNIQSSTKIETNIPALIQRLKLAESASNKEKTIKVQVEASEIRISARGDICTFEEVIPSIVEGPEINISANCKYLIDALEYAGDLATIKMSGHLHPIVIDGDTYNIVVPQRTH